MYKSNFIYHLSGSLRRAKGKLGHFTGKFHKGGSAAGSPGDRIAVIDISQSMRNAASKSSRLEVAIKITEAFIKRLGCDEPQSKISVIVFGKTAVIPISSVYTKNYYLPTFNFSIYTASVMPGTNITAGLQKAFDIINKDRNDGHVLLLSDGGHDISTGPEVIAEKLREYATLECIGIGREGDVNEDLLYSIASSYPDGSKQYTMVTDHSRPLSLAMYWPRRKSPNTDLFDPFSGVGPFLIPKQPEP